MSGNYVSAENFSVTTDIPNEIQGDGIREKDTLLSSTLEITLEVSSNNRPVNVKRNSVWWALFLLGTGTLVGWNRSYVWNRVLIFLADIFLCFMLQVQRLTFVFYQSCCRG